MKRFMKLLVVSLIALSLVACSTGDKDDTNGDGPKETVNLKRMGG